MRSASCRETSPATKPVRLSIQHRVQRLLDRSTNHLIKMIPDPRLINLDHLSIGFSSLIGCSFILEGTVIPESAKDSVRYHRKCGLGEHVAQFPQERDCAQEFLPGQQEIGRSECVRR